MRRYLVLATALCACLGPLRTAQVSFVEPQVAYVSHVTLNNTHLFRTERDCLVLVMPEELGRQLLIFESCKNLATRAHFTKVVDVLGEGLTAVERGLFEHRVQRLDQLASQRRPQLGPADRFALVHWPTNGSLAEVVHAQHMDMVIFGNQNSGYLLYDERMYGYHTRDCGEINGLVLVTGEAVVRISYSPFWVHGMPRDELPIDVNQYYNRKQSAIAQAFWALGDQIQLDRRAEVRLLSKRFSSGLNKLQHSLRNIAVNLDTDL